MTTKMKPIKNTAWSVCVVYGCATCGLTLGFLPIGGWCPRCARSAAPAAATLAKEVTP